jgi:hypothetical protein
MTRLLRIVPALLVVWFIAGLIYRLAAQVAVAL